MTRDAMVRAAADLLREGGAGAVTTRAVAHAAGVPTPAIFRQFGDKHGLMEAVADHVLESYVTAEAAARRDGDPLAELVAAWRTHIDFGLANPELYGLLFASTRAEPPRVAAAGFQVLEGRVARLAADGRLRVGVARAVAMIHAAGVGVVLSLLAQPVDARDHGLADAMLETVLAGLLSTRPAPPAHDLLGLAVTFDAAVPNLECLSAAERGLLTEWMARLIGDLQHRGVTRPSVQG